MRRYTVKERPLVLEFESNDSPRHLWFILVGPALGIRLQFAIRDHVRPHPVTISFRTLWPSLRRFSFHFEYQQRVMVGEIGAWVMCTVLIVANGDYKIRVGMIGKSANQIFKQDPSNPRWSAEIRVVADGVVDLGHGEQILAGQIARCPRSASINITSNLRVRGRGALRVRFQNELSVMCSS